MSNRLNAATLPPEIVRAMSPSDRKALKIRTPEEAATHNANLAERELQRLCESWLSLHGYSRLTAHTAADAPRGWFGHLTESERNPLMPDLLILSAGMRRCLMIELKVRGVYQPGQREHIEAGRWIECRTLEDFVVTVTEWESKQQEG